MAHKSDRPPMTRLSRQGHSQITQPPALTSEITASSQPKLPPKA